MDSERIGLKTLAQAAAAVLVVEAAAFLAISAKAGPPLVVLGAARLTDLGLLAAIVSTRSRGWVSVGLDRDGLFPGFTAGLVWSAGLGAAAAVGLAALYAAGFDVLAMLKVRLPEGYGSAALFFLVGGLLGPAAEEFFFRGLVYGFFRRWGAAAAVTVSTMAFVLAHGPGQVSGLTQIAGGLIFALAYEIHKKLTAPLTIHVLGNLALFSLGLFP